MQLLECVIVAMAMFGHVAIWVFIFNRLHALPWPCWLIRVLEKGVAAAVLAGFGVGGWMLLDGRSVVPSQHPVTALASISYLMPCCVIGLVAAGTRWRRGDGVESAGRFFRERTIALVHVARRRNEPLAVSLSTRVCAAIPGNQIFELDVNEKSLAIPGLPEELDGWTIAHLSDIHFTGRIARAFYDEVIDQTLSLEADLIAITGDIIDKARCLDWIPPTLGRLRAKDGAYVLLGNHDNRIRAEGRLRQLLADCGLIEIGGRAVEIETRGRRILIAGNERPWFCGLPTIPPTDNENVDRPFRLLLSHSPDEFAWAQRQGFDLMLAGHTHGGQVRLPLIGPVVAPSRYGVKYASGVFFESPTLMHVTRGVSGVHPLRINCRPELTRIILRRAED